MIQLSDVFCQIFSKNMGVSKKSGTHKSSILIGFSVINHQFWGTIIFGNTHISVLESSVVFYWISLISLEGLACSFYRKCHAKMTSLKDVHEPHSCFTGLSPPKHSCNHRRSCVGFYGKMCCNTSGGAKL